MAESTEGKLTPKFKCSFCCCSLSLEADCNEFVQTGRGERGRGQLLSQVSIAAGLFRFGVFCAEVEAQGSSYLVFLPSMGILPKFVYQPSVHSFQNACFIIVSAGEKQANKNNGESSRTQITGALYVGSMVREQHRSQCVLSSLYFW